jgi:DNA-binding transcriptional LysR family regulator
MLDLHRLRLLRELDARGTVHAAAAALGYSPSAVSQQLTVLEREVGVPVLERVGRGLRLTPAGQVLVRHATTLLEGVEAAEADVAALAAGGPAGTVRIAAFQSAMSYLVPPAIRALHLSAPDVRVEVVEAEIQQSAQALLLHAVDVALGDEFASDPSPIIREATSRTLLEERMHVVLPEGHPEGRRRTARLDRLADMAWAACSPGTGQYQMHLRLCRDLGGFEPDTRYASDDVTTLVELVRTAGAATLLPDLPLSRPMPGVVFRPVDGTSTGRRIYALTRRNSTPAVDVVVDALQAAADAVRLTTPQPRPKR